MPLPRALPNTLLFLCTSPLFIAPLLLSACLPIGLVLALLLLGVLLGRSVLVLASLLLGMLLGLSVLVLALLLLGTLLFGFGLLLITLLLLGMVLLFSLLVMLCVSRSSDSKKQRQNGRAADPNCVHMCYLSSFQLRTLALAQASSCHRAADGVAGYEKFHSPILLPASRIIVRGYRQSVAETLCADRVRRNALLHQIVAH